MMHVLLARLMEVHEYLDRLGAAAAGGPSLAGLRSLHENHLLNIPFENLDIHRGVEIVLDEEKILEKIVADVQRHAGDRPQLDDMTLVVIKREPT